MSGKSDCVPKQNEKDNGKMGSEDVLILNLVQVSLLFLVGLISTAIPEAAIVAIKLKWFTLILSLPPILVFLVWKPEKYFALHRALGIWVINSLIIIIAYLYNKAYVKREIHESNDLMHFSSDNGDSGVKYLPLFLGIVFGSIPVGGIFLGVLYVGKYYYRRIRSPGLVLLIILGITSISFFLLPTSQTKYSEPFKLTLEMVVNFFNLFRPVQVIILLFLISTTLTFPTLLKGSKVIRMVWIVSAAICFVHGPLCLCSALQIRDWSFILSGISAEVLESVCIFLLVVQVLMDDENLSTNKTYELTSMGMEDSSV